jgi:hypothetical protein
MNAARLEDLHRWKMEQEYVSRKGIRDMNTGWPRGGVVQRL